jgi:hypothetical protein
MAAGWEGVLDAFLGEQGFCSRRGSSGGYPAYAHSVQLDEFIASSRAHVGHG